MDSLYQAPLATLDTPTLGEIMLRDVPVLPPSTDLIQALKVLERSAGGVAMCSLPGEAPRVLTRSHCSELLISALQGFPVPQRIDQAAEAIVFQMFEHETVTQALVQLEGDMSAPVAIFAGDQLTGYVGPDQWSQLSLRLLAPDATPIVENPEDLIDPLTGLPDHRAYRMHLEMRLIDHQELDNQFCLALIELDWLDGLVQRHSMTEEQATIQRVSNLIISGLRSDDHLFSLEGGKWALVMTDVSPSIARGIARRLIDTVYQAAFVNHGSPLGRVSISIGLCGPGLDGDSTENDAEEALEQAIMSGGHQIRILGERLI